MPHGMKLFKVAVYGLLALNVALFILREKFTDSIDSIGWLVLVALFEYETMRLARRREPPWRQLLELIARVAGYTFIIYAWIGYYSAGEWLNFVNSTTWLLVVFTLEYDVRTHADYGSRQWHVRNAIKLALYGLLAAYAIIWAINGEWLDAGDAALWMLAFFVIELNVFGFERHLIEARAETDKTSV